MLSENATPTTNPTYERRRTVWKNIGSSRLEIGHRLFLSPGKVTTTRPWNLAFFKNIGGIQEEYVTGDCKDEAVSE